jgi:non-specific serine/threonine protein kinase/serine/threonine-protein kinase
VQELSDDIRRHLDGMPVRARGDTLAYRAAKFVGRHRGPVVAAVLVLASLLGGVVGIARQARIAREERAKAERRFADVRRLANEFLFEFHDAIADLPGSTKARELVVRRAAEYLDGLSRESQGNAALQRELASAFQRLGDVQGGGGIANLGDSRGALESYTKALALRESVVAQGRPEWADREGLALLHMHIGRFLVATGDLEAAEGHHRRSLALLEVSGSDPVPPPEAAGRQAAAYHSLGFVQARRGHRDAALESLHRAVVLGRRSQEDAGGQGLAPGSLALIESDLADQLSAAGRTAEALVAVQHAIRTLEGLMAADANNTRYRRHLIPALHVEAHALEALGRPADATASRARALAIARGLLSAGPEDRWNQVAEALGLRRLAGGLLRAGDTRAGLAGLREARAAGLRIMAADPANAYMGNELAAIHAELGAALLPSSPGPGCAHLREGVALWASLEQQGHFAEENAETRAYFEDLLKRCARP